jgi:hypothetical protein
MMHAQPLSFLVQLFSNEKSTNIIPVPWMLASSGPVSWNRSSSQEMPGIVVRIVRSIPAAMPAQSVNNSGASVSRAVVTREI